MSDDHYLSKRGTHNTARKFSKQVGRPRQRNRSEKNWSDDADKSKLRWETLLWQKLEREYLETPLLPWPADDNPERIAAYSAARQARYELLLRMKRLRNGKEEEPKPLGFTPLPHDSKIFQAIKDRVAKGQKQSLVMAKFCRLVSRDAVYLAYVQAMEMLRSSGTVVAE